MVEPCCLWEMCWHLPLTQQVGCHSHRLADLTWLSSSSLAMSREEQENYHLTKYFLITMHHHSMIIIGVSDISILSIQYSI